jgi:hypothetical protein
MSLYKRGRTWHTDFTVNGQRFRQSLDTTDWREAQAKEKERIAQASEGKLASNGVKYARLGFTEAAERYRESRKLELSETSQLKERHLLVQPCLFFKSDMLSRICSERLHSYREWRIGQKVSPATVNMEIGAIRRILKRANRWHLIASDLKPLKERRQFGRAMSLERKTQTSAAGGEKHRLANRSPSYDSGAQHDDAGLRDQKLAVA